MATAPRTKQNLVELLTELGSGRAPSVVADEICENFRVTKLPSPTRPEQPIPKAGQTWRNRQSDRLVKITSIRYDKVLWECVDDSRGQKFGRVYVAYWLTRFDFVSEAAE